MAVKNAVGNALTGSTGTGAFVGANSPDLVTPTTDELRHTSDIDNKIAFGADTQDHQTGGSSRLDLSNTGMRLGGANSRVTTILDEDNMSSDSATALATQQSIKAYVDTMMGSGGNVYAAQGRLTLTTAVPVTTSDVSAATTLYYALYTGNKLALYSGSAWVVYTFTELSTAVPSTTNTMYDVYIYSNAGTPTLELTAWTNDTTRATALTTQDGVYVKNGDATRRYVGSFRTTGSSGQTEDSLIKRYVWNYYNRVVKPMRAVETQNTWSYSTASYQQASANTANQLDMVIGVSEDMVEATVYGKYSTSGVTRRIAYNGIGLDSTTVNSAIIMTSADTTNTLMASLNVAKYEGYPGIGRHTLVWLEYGAGADTQVWQGDNGTTQLQTGIIGFMRG